MSNEDENNIVSQININKIQLDKNQPRKFFDDTSINELANSIINVGVINPIIVNRKGEFYQIVSGERRFRASKKANLKTIPAIIKNYDELETLEVALIENVQREDLNAIEEALTYRKLQDDFELTQEEISKKVGKSRVTITNSLRLLKLDDRVQNFIIEAKLSEGHARALLSIDDHDLQFELAEKIIDDTMSVRQIEELVKKIITKPKENSEATKKEVLTTYDDISKQLNQILGTKVNIKNNKDKGKIEIEYYSESDLDRLLSLLKQIKL